MKKVLFDGTAMQGSACTVFHGGAEYAKFIFRESLRRGFNFDVVVNDRMVSDKLIEHLLCQSKNVCVYHVNSIHEIYVLIDKNNYDVFYSALPYDYTDYSAKAKMIGVIHGLRSIELPWDSYRYKYYNNVLTSLIARVINYLPFVQKYLFKKYWKKTEKLLKIENSNFITVSEHSKYSLLTYFPHLNASSIQVYYSPFSLESKKIGSKKEKYFLLVSANRFEKNVCRVIESFDELISENRLEDYNIKVIGCGNQPFFSKIKNRDRFFLRPYVSTNELEELYSNAFCFVYPSLNEGFGYPPLKAMGYCVPVVASSATSIPEVCGDAALYFCPLEKGELKNRILQIVNRKDLREELISKGTLRVKLLLQKQEFEIQSKLDWIFNNE